MENISKCVGITPVGGVYPFNLASIEFLPAKFLLNTAGKGAGDLLYLHNQGEAP
jgi:hypothetical protein